MRGPAPPSAERDPTRAVLAVVGLGTFFSALSGSSVNLALPALTRSFGLAVDSAGWVVNAFLLPVTVLLLVAGRASDLLGHRRLYLAGFALVGLGSLGCALSPGFFPLIAARALQGTGGAMVMATGPALLTTTVPGERRGWALGMLATATYSGLTLGPIVGGWVLAGLGWRWIFVLNVPVVAIVIATGRRFLPARRGADSVVFDWPGTVTLLTGLPLLLLALVEGRDLGWTSPWVLASAAGGMTLLALFFVVEKRSPGPLLDLRLFRSYVFLGATLSAIGNYVALFVPIILMPFYLMNGLGLPAPMAGLLLSAQPLAMALVASFSGRLSDRVGSRGLATGGLLLASMGLLGMSTVGAATAGWAVSGWLAVMGFGTGIFISPNSSALMGAAPPHQQGVAGAVLAVARNLGMIGGVALGTTIFSAAGGRGAGRWAAPDFAALRLALFVAAGVSFASAMAAALRGGRRA